MYIGMDRDPDVYMYVYIYRGIDVALDFNASINTTLNYVYSEDRHMQPSVHIVYTRIIHTYV